jgi:hypothetical protein
MIGIAGAPGAVIINPLNIPGLKAWWDCKLTTGVTEGACTGVVDLSGNVNNLVATSPNRPINKAGLVKNGYRLVYFPPIGVETDWLTVAATTPVKINCPNGYTAFATFATFSSSATNDQPNVNPPNTLVGDVDASVYCNFGLNVGNVRYCYYDGAGAGWTSYDSTGLNLNNGSLHTICVSHSTDGNINLYADGNLVGSFTSASTWAATHGMSVIGIGYAYQDQFDDLNLNECMIFDASLSSQVIKQLHVRSRSIYGTQLYF